VTFDSFRAAEGGFFFFLFWVLLSFGRSHMWRYFPVTSLLQKSLELDCIPRGLSLPPSFFLVPLCGAPGTDPTPLPPPRIFRAVPLLPSFKSHSRYLGPADTSQPLLSREASVFFPLLPVFLFLFIGYLTIVVSHCPFSRLTELLPLWHRIAARGFYFPGGAKHGPFGRPLFPPFFPDS